MERNAFLQRVRQAAHRGRAHRVKQVDLPNEVGYVGSASDTCAALAAEINAVGGEAEVVDDPSGVEQRLTALLKQYDATAALIWKHALLDRLGICDCLAAAGAQHQDYDALSKLEPTAMRETILSVDIGISSVDYAVAETGTLTVCSKPGQERIISLLPPIHVAIVEESQIVPDLFDVFAQLDTVAFDDLPSNLAFITGPSKTGDIELQLTTGVHGPGKWHVVIVRTGPLGALRH